MEPILPKHWQHRPFTPRYKCAQCDYVTESKTNLKKHQLKHTGGKPFRCRLCPYATNYSSDLNRHSRVHFKKSEFSCVKCGYASEDGADFRRHVATHERGARMRSLEGAAERGREREEMVREREAERVSLRTGEDFPPRQQELQPTGGSLVSFPSAVEIGADLSSPTSSASILDAAAIAAAAPTFRPRSILPKGVDLQQYLQILQQPKERCRVCEDDASGIHYGALTCEACKGFFRRSMQKMLEYSCRRSNSCFIDKSTRNDCQSCRLRKCIRIGMKPDRVLDEDRLQRHRFKIEERRRNWRQHPGFLEKAPVSGGVEWKAAPFVEDFGDKNDAEDAANNNNNNLNSQPNLEALNGFYLASFDHEEALLCLDPKDENVEEVEQQQQQKREGVTADEEEEEEEEEEEDDRGKELVEIDEEGNESKIWLL